MNKKQFIKEYLEIDNLFVNNEISETTKVERHFHLAKRFAHSIIKSSSKSILYWMEKHDKLLEINQKLIKHNEILRTKNRKHL